MKNKKPTTIDLLKEIQKENSFQKEREHLHSKKTVEILEAGANLLQKSVTEFIEIEKEKTKIMKSKNHILIKYKDLHIEATGTRDIINTLDSIVEVVQPILAS